MTTEHPKISVLIPVYNVEKFLEHCLDSVLAQTFADFEVICVDDASPDTSPSILRRYATLDPRVRTILKTQNEGPMAARTDAIAAAQGEYLFFLDSDDYLPADALETLHRTATATRAELTIADMCLVSPTQKNVMRHRAANAGSTWLSFLKALLNGTTPSLCGMLFRKQLFNSFTATSLKNQTVSEDRMLLTEMLVNCRPSIATAEHNVYFYRSNSSSTTHHRTTDHIALAQLKALNHCHSIICSRVPELHTDADRSLANWLCLLLEQGITRRFLCDHCPEASRLLTYATLKSLTGTVKATHARLCSLIPGYSKTTHALHRLVWHLKGID